ncbi:MAG: class I SAM-dependent DNA methyltransferase [Flavobacteriales bacterium]
MVDKKESIAGENEMAEDFFTDIAVAFDDRYENKPDFKNRFAIWTKLIDQFSSGKKSAYDLGCGSGRYSFYIAQKGLKVTGVDASEGMLELCEKRKAASNIQHIQFLKDKLPLSSLEAYESVDLIISSSVIEYVEGFDKIMSDTHGLLNEGGVFIFSIPNKDSIHRKIEKFLYKLIGKPSYVRYLHNYKTLNDFKKFEKQYGFQLLEHAYYGEVSFVFRLLSKILPKRFCNTLLVGAFKKVER